MLTSMKNVLFQEYKHERKVFAEFDSEVRFRALAATGKAEEGLALLDKLDQHFKES